MSELTKKCQNDTIHCCDQCAVSENEIKRMIEEVKQACIEAVTKCDYEWTKGDYMGGQETLVRLDEAIKAIRNVK